MVIHVIDGILDLQMLASLCLIINITKDVFGAQLITKISLCGFTPTQICVIHFWYLKTIFWAKC